jgi:hypothetical protein
MCDIKMFFAKLNAPEAMTFLKIMQTAFSTTVSRTASSKIEKVLLPCAREGSSSLC